MKRLTNLIERLIGKWACTPVSLSIDLDERELERYLMDPSSR